MIIFYPWAFSGICRGELAEVAMIMLRSCRRSGSGSWPSPATRCSRCGRSLSTKDSTSICSVIIGRMEHSHVRTGCSTKSWAVRCAARSSSMLRHDHLAGGQQDRGRSTAGGRDWLAGCLSAEEESMPLESGEYEPSPHAWVREQVAATKPRMGEKPTRCAIPDCRW